MSQGTVPELLDEVVKAHADSSAYRYKKDGRWVDISWSECRVQVSRIARGLMAFGVKQGDRVGILGATRLEWILTDFGISCAGAATVGIYPSNLAADCAHIVNHADIEVLFVENADQLSKIVAEKENLPNLREVVIWDGDASSEALDWSRFLEKGDTVDAGQLTERSNAIKPDDLASLVYTSGTTGVPKGAMISHKNLVFTSWSIRQSMFSRPDYVALLFLPLAHVFARMIVYANLQSGTTIAIAEDLTKVAENMREIRPHTIPSVPRIFEKVYCKILSDVEAAGGMKKRIFDWAISVGRRVSRLKQQKRPISALLAIQNTLADKLVFHKIQAVFGGRLEYAVSGAAPLNKDIAEFFHACGVLILEGIGMTENTSFSNLNLIDNNKFGTVGPAGQGIEVKIGEDGEVLFRGDNIMQGYFKNPEATAKTFDDDGWLLSGDIGEIDEDGFLKITDRKKDLIITAGGKNIAPQRIERIMRTSYYIAQMMAYGDRKRYIAALVTLEPEALAEWAQANGANGGGVEELSKDPRVCELIQAEVDERNKQLASYETVKKFHILPGQFTIEGGELTPTQKLRRKAIAERYRAELEALF